MDINTEATQTTQEPVNLQNIDDTLEKAKVKPEETPDVDLCFMLDCTGSMASYIKMSCDKIQNIIEQVKELYPRSEIRIGIVAYRDVQDARRFEVLPFVASAENAKAFLGKLNAEGGGDTPEDVNGAFQKALFHMEWQNPVRILVLIADAPCHGKDFHSCDDSHPKGHKSDMDWDKIFKELVELRLDFLFLKISAITDKMFDKFKAMADKHGATELELSFTQELANQSSAIQTQTATGGKAPAKAEDHFAATIAHTIKASLHKEMKKGLVTKLNKRVEENAELMNNIKKSVAEIAAKFDFDELKSKYSDLAAKVGDCILSSNNFLDALADEDCLCLTFDIGRSQAAIADPTQIIIKNVYPSFLTAGSFFYSTEFALKKNKLAHGGFEKHAEGLILKGAAQENITGVMPLYFCEENWKVAKQLMKLTIGWDVTLDPLGYSYSQMKTVPFLILAKLAEMVSEKPNNEFLKFQFRLVKETCMQIMKDGSQESFENKFNKEVMDLYYKHVEDLSVRTIDVIANNSVFLAQVYIALECGGYEKKSEEQFEEFFKALLEEELRRRQRSFPDDFNINEWLFTILNVDVENYIIKPVNEYIDAQNKAKTAEGPEISQFEQKFLTILSAVKPTEAVEVKKEETAVEEKKEETAVAGKTEEKIVKGDPRSTEIVAYKQSFTTNGAYNETQTQAREEYEKTLKFVMRYLYPLRMLFTSQQAENPVNYKEWGIQNDDQFFALYIQNKMQSKNAARREAIANGVYKNPWTKAQEYIQGWYNKLIENEKASRITKYVNGIKNAKSEQQATVFASTENLNEAAGALLGACIGVDVSEFWGKLCYGGRPLVIEKVKMMLAGNYKGVKLYKDSETWEPSKLNCNNLFRGNKQIFTVDEWIGLLPKMSRNYVTWSIDK